jgi:hypothetical protein
MQLSTWLLLSKSPLTGDWRSRIPGMRQSRQKFNIFGQARRPAPTKVCRGDSLWSPESKTFDFDAVLFRI